MAPEDVPKTEFVTHDGQYKVLLMSLGMVNSGATVFRGLRKVLVVMFGVGSYSDDLVVYIDSWEEHLRKMKELFGRLRKS